MTEQRKEQFKTIAMILSLGYILIADVTGPLVKKLVGGGDSTRQEITEMRTVANLESARLIKLETLMKNMESLPVDVAVLKTDMASVKDSVAEIKNMMGPGNTRSR
jgi:uncharacterized protein (DUF2342 family)